MNDNRFDTVYGQLRNAYAMISAHEVLLQAHRGEAARKRSAICCICA